MRDTKYPCTSLALSGMAQASSAAQGVWPVPFEGTTLLLS